MAAVQLTVLICVRLQVSVRKSLVFDSKIVPMFDMATTPPFCSGSNAGQRDVLARIDDRVGVESECPSVIVQHPSAIVDAVRL